MDKTHMQVTIDDQLKREFKAACIMDGVSMSDVVEVLLKTWLDQRPKPTNEEKPASTPKPRGRSKAAK